MTLLDFNERHRLAILTAVVLDFLDEAYGESGLDDDSNPPQTELYNLASSVDELVTAYDAPSSASPFSGTSFETATLATGRLTRIADARQHSNRLLTAALMDADDDSRLGRLRAEVLSTLQEAGYR